MHIVQWLTQRPQLDRVQDADIRQPSVHRQDLTWVTDYLIGCHNASSPIGDADNDLCLFAGSNEYVPPIPKIPFTTSNCYDRTGAMSRL